MKPSLRSYYSHILSVFFLFYFLTTSSPCYLEADRQENFIIRKNIFQPVHGISEINQEQNGVGVPIDSFPFQLRGTMVSNSPLNSFALIEGSRTDQTKLYRIGDSVGGAKIVAIHRYKVVVEIAGERKYLLQNLGNGAASGSSELLSQTIPQISPLSREPIKISTREITSNIPDGTGSNSPSRHESKHCEGFRVALIQPGSLFETMGLKDGDVVKTVDEEPVDSYEKARQVYKELEEGSITSIQLERDNKIVTMTYGN